ncbi:DUF4013 domain-containing protein [Methanogenium organophilum]|uniref:DUF4013 domain-containing protein n=1 Tax=Methanogenium organophilum TaxID=2199 RepID=A0A9X9S613_METOG|nr:DUF4013 domain-containing protein [Methanogenium organophilum]WAI02151.1 DUF4013 domain-containing protein [Methanogenium organophilum]
MGIGDNLGESFEYAKEALVGKWVKWILLIIISIIPIVDFILYGYTIRVMRGIKPAPELEDYVQLFVDGLLYIIISIVWMIPAIIIGVILIGGSVGVAMMSDPAAAGAAIAGMGIGLLVTFIVAILCGLFATIGIVRFARMEKFGEAFAFGAIKDKIGEIGWGNYIISLIVVGIVVGIIYFILAIIPIIGWLLMFIALPFLAIFSARFICNLYDSAGTA